MTIPTAPRAAGRLRRHILDGYCDTCGMAPAKAAATAGAAEGYG